ncbi:hypothetical protein K432DRAFT_24718 [Lepidopterella palustris CBS 459.81]|uniref:Peptidase C14 caspase domain-containing protein n=1 Tax=Lepidopterella palustris CBS 459.81 TaxID=1314670 RepID=A0A8E2ECQ6_9PEZI|nr:hypothetical protein K432DRAFT_24718 [Lepidopterella palustris CBS 459.81]
MTSNTAYIILIFVAISSPPPSKWNYLFTKTSTLGIIHNSKILLLTMRVCPPRWHTQPFHQQQGFNQSSEHPLPPAYSAQYQTAESVSPYPPAFEPAPGPPFSQALPGQYSATPLAIDYQQDSNYQPVPASCDPVYSLQPEPQQYIYAPTPTQNHNGSASLAAYRPHTPRISNAQYGQNPFGTPPYTFAQGFPSPAFERYRPTRALLIGINYNGHSPDAEFGPLRGCHNDADKMWDFLRTLGFECITVMKDDKVAPTYLQPTKGNIESQMKCLVAGAQPHDSLFLFYSGHGCQLAATVDKGEDDDMDEAIVPSDYNTQGYIEDNWMHETLVKPLPAGVRLNAVFDCCHSGTALDLPYLYDTHGLVKSPHLGMWDSVRHAQQHYNRRRTAGKFSLEKEAPADVVMFSASKDSQLATQLNTGGELYGAITSAFITALQTRPNHTHNSLLLSIRHDLDSRNLTQKVQLSCSHWLDTSLLFQI